MMILLRAVAVIFTLLLNVPIDGTERHAEVGLINTENTVVTDNVICHIYPEVNAVYGKLTRSSRLSAEERESTNIAPDYHSCAKQCARESNCSYFVWHGNFSQVFGKYWVNMCVKLSIDSASLLGVRPQENDWIHQRGVVSGHCKYGEKSLPEQLSKTEKERISEPSVRQRRGTDSSSNYKRISKLPFFFNFSGESAGEERANSDMRLTSNSFLSEADIVDVGQEVTLRFHLSQSSTHKLQTSCRTIADGMVQVDTVLQKLLVVEIYGPDYFSRKLNERTIRPEIRKDSSTTSTDIGKMEMISQAKFVPTIAGIYTIVIQIQETDRYVLFMKAAFAQSGMDRELYSRILNRILATQYLTQNLKRKENHNVSESYESVDPKSPRKYYYYALAEGMNYGLGSHIEYMVAAFAQAIELNRTFVVPSSIVPAIVSAFGTQRIMYYWAEQLCPEMSWGCYFFLPSECSEADLLMAHRVKMELSMSNNKAQSSISMENTADEMLYLVDDGSPEFAQAEHEAVVVVGDPCQSHITKNAFQRLSRQFDLRKKSARAPPTSDHVGVPVREKKIFQTGGKISSAVEIAAVLAEFLARPLPWLLKGVAEEQLMLGFRGAQSTTAKEVEFSKEKSLSFDDNVHIKLNESQPAAFWSVHIRRTDKLVGKLAEAVDDVGTYSLKRYLDVVTSNMIQEPKSSNFNQSEKILAPTPLSQQVYIATDSALVVAALEMMQGIRTGNVSSTIETAAQIAMVCDNKASASTSLQALSSCQNIRFLYNTYQHRYEKGTILSLRSQPGSVDQNQEGYNAFKDFWLLSQGTGFVGESALLL